MKVSDKQFDELLAAATAQEIKNSLASYKLVPSLSQAKKLRQHLEESAHRKLRLGILHTYTSELLDPWLHLCASLNSLDIELYHAPYGVTVQEADAGSGLAKFAPDITLMLLQREDLQAAHHHKAGDGLENEAHIQRSLSGLLHRLRDTIGGHTVVTLLPTFSAPELGLYDAMAEHSDAFWWSKVKYSVAKTLRNEHNGTSFLDFDQLITQIGRDNFFDQRLWYSSAFPFTSDGAFAVANAVTTFAASLMLTKAKVIVLDADNTLWGGVIGEDGMRGIALGPDYPGNVYLDFQRRILSLQQRGFILALCSKNNPDDVNEVFEHHPHQLLKHEHFAAERVNWLPKPDNLRAIAEELNLGLDSLIFVDDSDYECTAVRHSLPEVDVIQVPSRAPLIPQCLDFVARLEIVTLTSEDLDKTAMYAQERQRKSQYEQLTQTGGSIEDYLRSLNMTMTVGLDEGSNIARLAQLTQKTNQFNLTTRRYTEADMSEKLAQARFRVYHFSLADNFGDSGIVGLAIVDVESATAARLDTFLMSCRVIGRMAEQAFLYAITVNLRAAGVTELTADYIPTRKNVLVEAFLPDNGFVQTSDGRYRLDLASGSDTPEAGFPLQIQGSFLP